MKTRVDCVYKNVCNGFNQKCRRCQLRYAHYDKKIAAQLERESQKSRYKYEDDRQALAQQIMAAKSAK